MDYIYVQAIPMLHMTLSKYKFRIIEAVRDRSKPNRQSIIDSTKKVVNIYNARGLQISQITADNEFDFIREHMRHIPINIVAAGEHVILIKRSNITVKEHTRCHVHRLPYVS